MLISIFKSNQRIVNAFTGIVAIALWLVAFYRKEGDFLLDNKWLDMLVTVTLITLQAVWMNRIVNNHKLIERTTYLTSLCYVAMASTAFFSLSFHLILIANTFIIAAFWYLLHLYNLKDKLHLIFNASLLIGIAVLFYHPYVVFLPFVWFVVIYISSSVWRDFIISLIGFALPLVYLAAYYFIFNDLHTLNWTVDASAALEPAAFAMSLKTLLIVLGGLLLVAFYVLLQMMSRSIVRVRRLLWMVLVMGVLMAATFMLNGNNLALTLASLVLPVSVVMAAFFERLSRTWLAESLFLLFLANLIWVYFS
ncbi:MAG: hypothetical protein KDD41_04465 [Flavobacteriales bacterium]|nr:hypothetical protein [Flavobacteriales bacterium]